MYVTVRGVSDRLRAKPYWLAAVLIVGILRPTYGQAKYETAQQTNDKIQQLSTLASFAGPAWRPGESGWRPRTATTGEST